MGQTLSLQALWETSRAKILRRKLARDVGVLTVANAVIAALSFAQGILVARWLGPELYGLTALVMSYPDLLYSLLDARSGEASVKYLAEFHARSERDRVLAMCKLGYAVDFVIAALSFLAVFITASWLVPKVTNRPGIAGLILIYAVSFLPRALVGTSQAVLATLGRFSIMAWVDMVTTMLRVVLVVGFTLTGWQVAGVVCGYAVAIAATGLVYGGITWTLISRTWGMYPFQGNWHALKGRYREIFGFLAYSEVNTRVGHTFKATGPGVVGLLP